MSAGKCKVMLHTHALSRNCGYGPLPGQAPNSRKLVPPLCIILGQGILILLHSHQTEETHSIYLTSDFRVNIAQTYNKSHALHNNPWGMSLAAITLEEVESWPDDSSNLRSRKRSRSHPLVPRPFTDEPNRWTLESTENNTMPNNILRSASYNRFLYRTYTTFK